MPIGKVEVGTHWGALECIAVNKDRERVVELGRGIKETWKQQEAWRLRCGCGQEVEVWASEFVGKRRMKDCGCGRGRDRGDDLPTNVSLSMPIGLRRELMARASKEGVSFNRVCVGLLRYGVEMEEVDNETDLEVSNTNTRHI